MFTSYFNLNILYFLYFLSIIWNIVGIKSIFLLFLNKILLLNIFESNRIIVYGIFNNLE